MSHGITRIRTAETSVPERVRRHLCRKHTFKIVGAISKLGAITLLADVLLVVMFVRMLSKHRYKRAHENELYLQKTEKLRRGATERINRVKNSKKYRYFKCPKCKKLLRIPRGVGSVTITCKDCGTKFDKKA